MLCFLTSEFVEVFFLCATVKQVKAKTMILLHLTNMFVERCGQSLPIYWNKYPDSSLVLNLRLRPADWFNRNLNEKLQELK